MERDELEKRLTFAGFGKFRNVSGEASVIDMFPEDGRTGIYVLCFKEGNYYVGKATDVVDRFRSHAREKCKIEAISFKPVKADELTVIERKTIAGLVSMDVPLRNITDTPNPDGRTIKTPDGSLLNKEVKRLWHADVKWNDLTGTPVDDALRRSKYIKKFKEFMTIDDAPKIVAFMSEYLRRCMPLPRQTAFEYWIVSCLPKKGLQLANITVNFQWVVVCKKNRSKETELELWARATTLQRKYGYSLEALENNYNIKTGTTDLVKGGTDQIKIITNLENAAKLLQDDVVVDAIRDLNMDLMMFGRSPFKQFHCFDLSGLILEKIK